MKYLILDLDKTLIYNNSKRLRSKKINNIIFRPYLIEFLKDLKKYYHLGIFTAGNDAYCEMVSRLIEKNNKFFEIKLCDRNLSKKKKKKDLKEIKKRIGKKYSDTIKKIIMVDDNESYFTNKRNSIKIKPFLGSPEDDKLEKLKYILKKLANMMM